MSVRVETAPRAATLLARLAAGHPGLWIVPANVCLAAPLGLMVGGARIEVVDINASSLCLDVEAVHARCQALGAPVAGVLYVRTYGRSDCTQDDLRQLRQKLGAKALIVDDACLSMPQTEPKRALHPEADVVVFSTGPRKPIDLGGGAYAVMNSDVRLADIPGEGDGAAFDALERRARQTHAPIFAGPLDNETRQLLSRWLPTEDGEDWSDLKVRIDAAIAPRKAQTQVINAIYNQELSDFNPLCSDAQSWRYTLRLADPQGALTALFDAGLFASRHYRPIAAAFGSGDAPQARRLYSQVLNLFNDHNFSPAQARETVKVLRQVARTSGA